MKYFLKLTDIPGESTQEGHVDEIVVTSFAWGVTNESVATQGAPRPTFSELTLSGPLGSHSPKLLLACATGRHLDDATLYGLRDNGNDVLRIQLEEVFVTSYHTSGDDGVKDEYKLGNARRVHFTVFGQSTTGGPTSTTVAYDIHDNKAV